MTGKLVTRNTDLEAPKGMKSVLVFGVISVPVDSPLGGNRLVDVDENLMISVSSSKSLHRKFAAWNAPDVCEEIFNLDTMRESSEMAFADEGLALIADGKYDDPKFPAIVKKLKEFIADMPPFDMMKQVLESIVKSFERKKSVD